MIWAYPICPLNQRMQPGLCCPGFLERMARASPIKNNNAIYMQFDWLLHTGLDALVGTAISSLFQPYSIGNQEVRTCGNRQWIGMNWVAEMYVTESPRVHKVIPGEPWTLLNMLTLRRFSTTKRISMANIIQQIMLRKICTTVKRCMYFDLVLPFVVTDRTDWVVFEIWIK